jgi:hypothetical protein
LKIAHKRGISGWKKEHEGNLHFSSFIYLSAPYLERKRKIKNQLHNLLLGVSPQWQIDAHFVQSLAHNFATLLGLKHMINALNATGCSNIILTHDKGKSKKLH